ncbi:MAG: phenylalanine--tRNA ligase subunit alpha [Bifidobacteriaceae bacterium]|jgi:phenylalanyl-tRNA synthetase alpha chain|nr:phenylalanine--tRNA ligase subunit alpha [Bifidobacteriaceae bacterium]
MPNFNIEQLNKSVNEGILAFSNAKNIEELKKAKISYLADKSPISESSKLIGALPAEKRAEAGKVLGCLRTKILDEYNAAEIKLKNKALQNLLENEYADISLPFDRRISGARHPLSELIDTVSDFFTSLGWTIADGPELEAEWFNFDALNFAPDHPARAMQDTFYTTCSNLVLRTHTSPVQARAMLSQGVPIYIAVPGKVFRSDELDTTHTPVFHQIEGLAVDKGLNMTHLKGCLEIFAKAMFGQAAKTRIRPSYFPFTEPSGEIDVWFEAKKGGSGWIEWGGCGMVHPNVLRSVGVDPNIYTGFAFGIGLERTLNLRHGITDMHDLVEGDIRFAHQFIQGGIDNRIDGENDA